MVSAGAVSCARRGPIGPGAPESLVASHPNEPAPAAPERTRRARSYGDHHSAGPAAAAGAPRTD
jgi:hypothetical protein